jgi:hypothetical protein
MEPTTEIQRLDNGNQNINRHWSFQGYLFQSLTAQRVVMREVVGVEEQLLWCIQASCAQSKPEKKPDTVQGWVRA